jgi:hypothetical protein
MTWHMWDHRISVNNANETATLSIEVNERIGEEYEKGFKNLSTAARQPARQPREQLQLTSLGYRQQWVRAITANRKFQEEINIQKRPAKEILEAKGYVWWLRNGRPSLEAYRAMEQQKELEDL